MKHSARAMKLGELRSVAAVAASGYRVTAAAEAMHTSQPGVSRHVQQIENLLGVTLFERQRHRLTGPTAAGRVLLPEILRVVNSVDGLQALASQLADGSRGSLTVAASHTHARFLLPRALESFIKDHPLIRVQVRQGTLDQIVNWMMSGEADLSLSSVPARPPASLEFHPLFTVARSVLVPRGHALLKKRKLTLDELARYPIITYGREFAAYAQIVRAFEERGLEPAMALNTSDTDTIKTYAACGLGVAIVAHTAFEPKRDKELRAIDASHLFPSSVVGLGRNRERPLSAAAQHLAALLAPELRAHTVVSRAKTARTLGK